uniref:C-type lectin domain-containing protein n=2 Tax=Meleagris gallopavo TaxID=9103 RepID=A0A803YP07_MELGA
MGTWGFGDNGDTEPFGTRFCPHSFRDNGVGVEGAQHHTQRSAPTAARHVGTEPLLVPGVPPGWRLHGGSCYMVGSGAVGWAQAQGRCRDSGAQLVVIGDAQEQEFLTSLAPPHETWIGLHDRSTEGSFQWVDGSALSFRWDGSRGHRGSRGSRSHGGSQG